MEPTSALGGVLIGVLSGVVIMLVVLFGVYLSGKWRRAVTVVHPVAEDLPHRKTPVGELPRVD
jgi:hypothetical protein